MDVWVNKMREIYIPFNPWSKDKLDTDEKICTTRTKRYGYPGDYFYVKGVKYVLVEIRHISLNTVANDFYKEEGCESSGEFVQVWNDIHPFKGFVSEQIVYLHIFRKV